MPIYQSAAGRMHRLGDKRADQRQRCRFYTQEYTHLPNDCVVEHFKSGIWNRQQQIFLKFVNFKEYDKMGEGGFCTVYRCPTDESRVYKVVV